MTRYFGALAPKLQAQLADRPKPASLARELAETRRQFDRCVLFFCSSAGEFEQIRPLVERLQARPSSQASDGEAAKTFVHVLFFSRSGLDYIKARKDSVSASLAPLGDSIWMWNCIFTSVRPNLVVVVRHEIWPGFIASARAFAPVHLVAASMSLGEAHSWQKKLVRGFLLKKMDRIFTVSNVDHHFFSTTYGVPSDRMRTVGDPKYDRVLERAAERTSQTQGLRSQFEAAGRFQNRIVCGSIHPPDLEAILTAYRLLGSMAQSWQLILAPHHLTREMLGAVATGCEQAGISLIRFSELSTRNAENHEKPNNIGTFQAILFDVMGQLAEAYGTADAAYVGGAMHHQVHNVLEPACRGLAISIGPHFNNSQEARDLVAAQLITVVQDPKSLAKWWSSLAGQGQSIRPKLLDRMHESSGATDKIVAEWTSILNSGRQAK